MKRILLAIVGFGIVLGFLAWKFDVRLGALEEAGKRTVLGAATKISDLTSYTPVGTDELPINDTSNAITKKTTVTNFLSVLSGSYPVIKTGNVFSFAFGTTTNNNWSGLNVFQGASTTIVGNLTIGGNATATFATTTSFFSTTASSTALRTSSLGIASSTPTTKLSLGQGAILVPEYQPATSTSMTIDWRNGNQQLVRTGTAATAIAFSNFVVGQKLALILCNPGSSAGAITFSGAILWPANTIPTTTTTANKCDIFTFLATNGTSTPVILGGYNQAY